MSAGREDEHLLGVLRTLCEELDDSEPRSEPSPAWSDAGQSKFWSGCDDEGDEQLVPQLRGQLARLAWIANGGTEGDPREERVIRAALDGAELVMRGEIASRRQDRIASHLPGFAFTVTYPGLGRARAIELSRRAAELIDADPPTDARNELGS